MARIYQTATIGEAHVRAALVDVPGMADLCVLRVGTWAFARGDALWFITENRYDATIWVYFGTIGESEVRVCFVHDHSQAGWLRPHRLQGRFASGFRPA